MVGTSLISDGDLSMKVTKGMINELLENIPEKQSGRVVQEWSHEEESAFIAIVSELIKANRTVKATLDTLAARDVIKGRSKTALYKKWQEHTRALKKA